MFSFFTKFFNKKNESNENNLITTLKNDHKKLIDIYVKIDKAMEKNDFVQAKYEIKNFVNEYNKHILLEDTQLYIALEENFKNYKNN